MFVPEAVELVRDDEGGIVYHPPCVPVAEQRRGFDELCTAVVWRSQQRPMYDRIVDVPRLMASVALDDPACPPCLVGLLAAACAVAPAPYTRAGLNLYRNGGDSVAMHGDRVHELTPGCPIAIVSLGAPRDMLIRPRQGGGALRVCLAPGSVLVMSRLSQTTHLHGIPKTSQAAGARISVAFRGRRC